MAKAKKSKKGKKAKKAKKAVTAKKKSAKKVVEEGRQEIGEEGREEIRQEVGQEEVSQEKISEKIRQEGGPQEGGSEENRRREESSQEEPCAKAGRRSQPAPPPAPAPEPDAGRELGGSEFGAIHPVMRRASSSESRRARTKIATSQISGKAAAVRCGLFPGAVLPTCSLGVCNAALDSPGKLSDAAGPLRVAGSRCGSTSTGGVKIVVGMQHPPTTFFRNAQNA